MSSWSVCISMVWGSSVDKQQQQIEVMPVSRVGQVQFQDLSSFIKIQDPFSQS